jgi:hypothetical protein
MAGATTALMLGHSAISPTKNWQPWPAPHVMLWLRQMQQQQNRAAQKIPADVLAVCHRDRLLELAADADRQLLDLQAKSDLTVSCRLAGFYPPPTMVCF